MLERFTGQSQTLLSARTCGFESHPPHHHLLHAMTRPAEDVERAAELARNGRSIASIARELQVSRYAVRSWLRSGPSELAASRRGGGISSTPGNPCHGLCGRADTVPPAPYAYLLAQYLGDGYIAEHARAVFRLRITCCDLYPAIMEEVEAAMRAVMPASSVGRTPKVGCTDVASYSKHWPCLLPQHGPGRKHERRIVLEPWQEAIVRVETRAFVRGLIHSDGSRSTNRVQGRAYAYPRYFFSNRSEDILDLFGAALDGLGIAWRRNGRWSISVARREAVAALDAFVGPKR